MLGPELAVEELAEEELDIEVDRKELELPAFGTKGLVVVVRRELQW